ncbi:hypothetical protein [Pontibacter sp. G13]|uniref:hypothetical protein n=1 Tax=Pontibacter sp. G13 TaxID=3074898 RepID=UPI00288BE7C8|nr:hypothetical protein [Pontibacter sp. G13]WNJ19474.1 hypothetical protein RJD25_03185 [Pontibacter sp. G13]
MKTRFSLLLLAFGMISSLAAQTLERQVIGAAGMHATAGNLILSMTVGETATSTLEAGSFVLTQGFQQPDVTTASSIDPQTLVDWKLYPNPATAHITLELSMAQAFEFTSQVVDLAGRSMGIEHPISGADGHCLTEYPIGHLAEGVYLLLIQDLDGTPLQAIRFEKIH